MRRLNKWIQCCFSGWWDVGCFVMAQLHLAGNNIERGAVAVRVRLKQAPPLTEDGEAHGSTCSSNIASLTNHHI
jgi:hypothetical protein